MSAWVVELLLRRFKLKIDALESAWILICSASTFVILSETKNLVFKIKQTAGFFATLRMTEFVWFANPLCRAFGLSQQMESGEDCLSAERVTTKTASAVCCGVG